MKYFSTLFLFFFTITLLAQNKKVEFRGVWVSTVANIDWPSQPNLDSETQQHEIIAILDKHKQNRINAIILQIRPTADAIYPSELEPWSKYLTGIQGQAPDPYYDPLAFWITEAHKRGMELHAWFNPYRIKQNISDTLAPSHILNKHPEWGWKYGDRVYFEPGNPRVWDFVTKVVIDVVKRYDIDAVHFDDYFYPYQIKGEDIPDAQAFKTWGGEYYPKRLADWRRHNTDTIIQKLSQAIKNTKPWVKFGISPFGVWRNRSQDVMGSETTAGTNNYDLLFADVIKWQREGWIDYLMPQLYWEDNHKSANYSTLAYWWNDFSYHRSLYFGLAPYRFDKKSESEQWRSEKHFFNQLDILRSLNNVNGFSFFSSNHFFRNDFKKINHRLVKNYCPHFAIIPPMPWIDNIAPAYPINLAKHRNKLIWETESTSNEFDKARFFVLYKYDLEESRFLKKAENIIAITGNLYYEFENDIPKGIYRLSSLDRLNNESQLSEPFIVK